MSRVLVAGCGYVGSRLAELLVEGGDEVWGLRRRPVDLPDGVEPIAADVTESGSLRHLPAGLDAVVYAVSPAGRTAEAYRLAYVEGFGNLLDAVSAPVRTVLVSSTGVYGYADGRWVDEETPESPADTTAGLVLAGEAVVRSRGVPGVVVRLGGIYGPGRTRTIRRVLEGDAPRMAPDVYGNRIHRDDAAGALRHVLRLDEPAPVYLGVDLDPASLRDVYAWIAERGKARDPCESAEAGGGGRRGTNKRCSSRRLQDSGYAFRYPTFREGYGPLVEGLVG